MKIDISGSLATAKLRLRVAEVLRIASHFLGINNFFVEVNLVGSDTMNKNVLSYEAPTKFILGNIKEKFLGEIYLNPEYIKNHDESFDLMLIHGFLHLLGYVHDKENDRIKMELIEEKLCALLSD
jgi:rRNA maturation RNase YbeY